MPVVCLLMILAVCTLPCAAAAQPWADAYRAGDYRKAADLLHPVVIDQHLNLATDPAPARHLAILYARGLGVARDAIAACSLAQISDMAAHMGGIKYADDVVAYEASLEESQRFMRGHCEGLTAQERANFPFGHLSGRVINQSPGPGSMVDRGSTVGVGPGHTPAQEDT